MNVSLTYSIVVNYAAVTKALSRHILHFRGETTSVLLLNTTPLLTSVMIFSAIKENLIQTLTNKLTIYEYTYLISKEKRVVKILERRSLFKHAFFVQKIVERSENKMK